MGIALAELEGFGSMEPAMAMVLHQPQRLAVDWVPGLHLPAECQQDNLMETTP